MFLFSLITNTFLKIILSLHNIQLIAMQEIRFLTYNIQMTLSYFEMSEKMQNLMTINNSLATFGFRSSTSKCEHIP